MRSLLLAILLLLILAGPAAAQTAADSAAAAWVGGDQETAVQIYERLLARDSTDTTALHRVALYKAWNREFDVSLALFDRLLELRPRNTEARVHRMNALAWSGRLDDAIAAAEAILERNPDEVEVIEAIARFTAWSGRYDESLRYYAGVIARRPADVDARLGRARVLAWSRRFDRAEVAFRGVLELDPDNLEARKGLARVAGWSGRLLEGERRWRDVVSANPQDVDALVGLASTLRWQGRTGAALDVLRQADSIDAADERLETERRWLHAAAGPRVTPTFLYESDSDGNRMETYRVQGTWLVTPSLGVQLVADAREFEQEQIDVADTGTRSAELVLSLGLGAGWTVTGGGGARTGTEDAQETVGLWRGELSSPSHLPVSASIGVRRSVFDYTAQLARNDVTVEELSLSLAGKGFANRLRLSARGAVGRFGGPERNTRWLAGASASYQVGGPVTVGLNARAFGFDKDLNAGYWDPELYGLLEAPVELSLEGDRLYGSIEVAPGYQTIDHARYDADNMALRTGATLGVRFAPGRRIGVSGMVANSGLQRLSPEPEAEYEYRSVRVFVDWALR